MAYQYVTLTVKVSMHTCIVAHDVMQRAWVSHMHCTTLAGLTASRSSCMASVPSQHAGEAALAYGVL